MEQNFSQFTARVAAKLNLSLAVTGKRGGLHTLDMIVCPYEKLWDEATFLPQNSQYPSKMPHIDLKIESAYDGFVPELFENFFLKKLDVIAREFGASGTLVLKKNIPLGAGLGGSSSATVAAIKSVQKYLENVDDEQKDKKFLGSVLVDLIYELSEEYELLEKKLYI